MSVTKYLLLPILCALALLSGCQTTPETDGRIINSGFLHDYSLLQPKKNQPKTLYFESKPENWPLFQKVYIAPVKIFSTNNAKLSNSERKLLSIYFENSLKDAVSQYFQLADKASKNTVTARAAITHINTISGFAAFNSQQVKIEGELLNNQQQTLISIIDSAESTSSETTWDQITHSLDKWSQMLAKTLVKNTHDIALAHTPKSCSDSPKDNKQHSIKELISLANKSLKAKRLSSPVNTSALTRYCQTLALSPYNMEAILGINRIIEKYTAWGHAALTRKQISKAEHQLAKAKKLLPNHPEVVTLQQKITAAKEQRKVEYAKQKNAITNDDIEFSINARPVTTKKPTASEVFVDPWRLQKPAVHYSWDSRHLKPFIHALTTDIDIKDVIASAKKRLMSKGFSIVGEYSPFASSYIIVISNKALESIASKTPFGGFGSTIRIGITQSGKTTTVSYNNPLYINQVYRLKGSLKPVANQIASAIGKIKPYGSTNGFSARELRQWHYMIGMPYFDDVTKLGSSSSHQDMINTIELALKNRRSGTSLVYRLDLPGKKQTVFGIGMRKTQGADSTVMRRIDKAKLSHLPHLPYEILVTNGTAYALKGNFRIPQSFPDLTMTELMPISDAPDDIKKTLQSLVK